MAVRRQATSTSSFGVSRRESHDSTEFYARFTAPELSDDARVDPHKDIDEIFCGDSRSMTQVADRSVALVVTSPPYFAGKEYEAALGEGHVPATYLDYLRMLEEVFAECVRTLEPGGRIAVNVANLGRKPYRSLSADVTAILQDRLRLLLRGEVLWQKSRGATSSCAWGSFQRPSNPVLRDLTERVVIASKGRFDRAIPAPKRFERGLPSETSLSRDEFMEATTDVWEMAPESASRVGHPAPFPVELPERLIHLNTYYGDLVLDPFAGSGTTAIAALRTGRHFVGYDTDEGYVEGARRRIHEELTRLRGEGEAGDQPLSFRIAAGTSRPAGLRGDDDPPTLALREGRAAKEVAQALIEACGFAGVEIDARVAAGVEVSFRAYDEAGRAWLFDVAGGFTSTRGGLRRADVLWKALGRASVVHEVAPEAPLVILTTEVPAPKSAAARMLDVVSGAGKPIFAVVRLQDADDRRRLRSIATQGPCAPAR